MCARESRPPQVSLRGFRGIPSLLWVPSALKRALLPLTPSKPHEYLYQILVETWKGENISSSESFNLSPRVLLGFLKRRGPGEYVFNMLRPLSARLLPALLHQGGSDPGVSRGRGVRSWGQACQKGRGHPAWSSPRPPPPPHL